MDGRYLDAFFPPGEKNLGNASSSTKKDALKISDDLFFIAFGDENERRLPDVDLYDLVEHYSQRLDLTHILV